MLFEINKLNNVWIVLLPINPRNTWGRETFSSFYTYYQWTMLHIYFEQQEQSNPISRKHYPPRNQAIELHTFTIKQHWMIWFDFIWDPVYRVPLYMSILVKTKNVYQNYISQSQNRLIIQLHAIWCKKPPTECCSNVANFRVCSKYTWKTNPHQHPMH